MNASNVGCSVYVVPHPVLGLFVRRNVILGAVLVIQLAEVPIYVDYTNSVSPFPISFETFVTRSGVNVLMPFYFRYAMRGRVFH